MKCIYIIGTWTKLFFTVTRVIATYYTFSLCCSLSNPKQREKRKYKKVPVHEIYLIHLPRYVINRI